MKHQTKSVKMRMRHKMKPFMTNTLFVSSHKLDGKYHFHCTSGPFPVSKKPILVKLVKSNIDEDVFLQDVIPKVKKSVRDRSIGHQNWSLNRPGLEHHQPGQSYRKRRQIMMTHHMNAIAEYPDAIATMCKSTHFL